MDAQLGNIVGKAVSRLNFCSNIDCGYPLVSPRRGGSNEYPQSMFLCRNEKNLH